MVPQDPTPQIGRFRPPDPDAMTSHPPPLLPPAEGRSAALETSSLPSEEGLGAGPAPPVPPEGPGPRTPKQATSEGGKRALGKLLLFGVLVGGGLAMLFWTPAGDALSREGILGWIEALRGWPWAPVVFVPAYAAAVALGLPGSALTLAGGAVFGVGWGTVFNWLGANLGANLAYLLARLLGREGLVWVLGSGKRGRRALARIDRAVVSHGFRGLLTLRLIPAVPFNLLNFAAGLVGMSWAPYALATAVGILPGAFVYTLFADALLQGSAQASREAFLRLVLAGLLLVVLTFLPGRLVRRRSE